MARPCWCGEGHILVTELANVWAGLGMNIVCYCVVVGFPQIQIPELLHSPVEIIAYAFWKGRSWHSYATYFTSAISPIFSLRIILKHVCSWWDKIDDIHFLNHVSWWLLSLGKWLKVNGRSECFVSIRYIVFEILDCKVEKLSISRKFDPSLLSPILT